MTVRSRRAWAGGPAFWWAHWPQLDYGAGLSLQHRLHVARGRGEIPDAMVVTEHPPTVTLGRRGSLADLPLGTTRLAAKGIALYRVRRGGRATYHGPGQVMIYPIVDVRTHRVGPRRFVANMEEALQRVLGRIGIAVARGETVPGLWVDGRKIAAIGVQILDGITRHGVALNLGDHLAPFDLILPCGGTGSRPTSVRTLGVEPPTPRWIGETFAAELATILGLEPRAVDRQALDRNVGNQQRDRSGAAWLSSENVGE